MSNFQRVNRCRPTSANCSESPKSIRAVDIRWISLALPREKKGRQQFTKAEVRSVHAQRIWPVLTYASFLCSVLLAHFVTRCLGMPCDQPIRHKKLRGMLEASCISLWWICGSLTWWRNILHFFNRCISWMSVSLFSYSVHKWFHWFSLGHPSSGLFTQRCLLNQHGEGVQIRCGLAKLPQDGGVQRGKQIPLSKWIRTRLMWQT